MNNYTGLKLSKLLADNGFKLPENECWWDIIDNKLVNNRYRITKKGEIKYDDYVPAYDILNDLCVRYAKEIFGEELSENKARFYNTGYCTLDNSDNAILQIGTLLRLDRKDEAEDYIWEHCLFNSKNK